jgi:hypothetical protein
MFIYVLAAAVALIVALWRPILRVLTPKGIPGIPAYPDPKPIWGDIPRMKQAIETHGGFSPCFDDMAKDLGVISQLRLGFFKT